MLSAISQGFKLWATNLPLLTALVWTVWVPGNLLLTYFTATADEESALTAELRMPMLIEGVFGPLYFAAIIYALDRRRQGKYVGYFESLGAGIRLWGRLFLARLITNLIISVGLLLLVIPGIVLAVRYMLLDMLVVLDDCEGGEARERSWELTHGRSWALFSVATAFYLLFMMLTAVLQVPLAILYEVSEMTLFQYHVLDFIASCVLDIVPPLLTAVVYCFYLQASGRDYELGAVNDAGSDEPFQADSEALETDAGNPYRPPREV